MKNIKVPFLLVTLLIAALFQACNNSEGKNDTTSKRTEAIPVKVMKLTQIESEQTIQTAGLFSTDDETYLAFKTGGIIEKVYVKEGDAIKKGQLLATLNLTEIEAHVAQARLGFEKASRDFKRVENLYKDSVATLEQYQNSKTGMEVALRQLESANFNKSYSEIRAMRNGFVLKKMASEGQVIAPGTSVFQTNGAGQSNWILKAGVSDREWASINIGDSATITCDAMPNKKFFATVTRKSEGTDMNGAFTIELTLSSSEKGLASGLFGKATIQGTRKQTVWEIPYDALLDGNAQSGYVFVTTDQKKAHKVQVVVSQIEKDYVTVQAGLENFTWLITSGSAYLKEGTSITIQN
jgi:RND family efflux transporter MFP subunit